MKIGQSSGGDHANASLAPVGDKGWVVLFKGADALSAAASLPWGGGLALALLVCFLSYTFFFFGSMNTDDD